MNAASIHVRVPATTANLGPGFDCLALALDLWNEAVFTPSESGIVIQVQGEGADVLPRDGSNLVAVAVERFFEEMGLSRTSGFHIVCRNRIPLGSGLGSSAAAVLTGLLAANALAGNPATPVEILKLAHAIEGHPDNVTAALFGGLVIVVNEAEDFVYRRFDIPALPVAIALPLIELSTHAARQALPAAIPLSDAVFNLGRTALVVEALRSGDFELLSIAMQDRLHQPYRMDLIPGSAAAIRAARQAGAAAAALSGAGPGVIAFCDSNPEPAAEAMAQAFRQAGVAQRTLLLNAINEGAAVESTAAVGAAESA
ncbi:MAG: homoserine kinase [Anaerolineaceae bacterium]|nr:homoserine kinase [Anaerolineaceae bacterium]